MLTLLPDVTFLKIPCRKAQIKDISWINLNERKSSWIIWFELQIFSSTGESCCSSCGWRRCSTQNYSAGNRIVWKFVIRERSKSISVFFLHCTKICWYFSWNLRRICRTDIKTLWQLCSEWRSAERLTHPPVRRVMGVLIALPAC